MSMALNGRIRPMIRSGLGPRSLSMVSPYSRHGTGPLGVNTNPNKIVSGQSSSFSSQSKRVYVPKGSFNKNGPAKVTSVQPTSKSREGAQKKRPTFNRKVTIVDTKDHAKKILKILEAHPDVVWACDTEVMDIDLKLVGPVGNGRVTCVSIYGGPEVDFGDGPGTSLWIDNIGPEGEIVQIFKAWFESNDSKKVWHNYGFDRHVMGNENINCGGFYGDTFHMARLWNTARDKVAAGKDGSKDGSGYALADLSRDLLHDDMLKTKMIDLFGVAKPKKDGTPGKVKTLPPIREIQESPEHRGEWIWYSALDAIATWWVHHELEEELKKKEWVVGGQRIGSMWEFYREYFCPFGELLTEMEKNGIRIDTDKHLKEAEALARKDRDEMQTRFLNWAANYTKDAWEMNIASSQQVGQFLFGQYTNRERVQSEWEFRSFKMDKSETELKKDQDEAAEQNPYIEYSTPDLKKLLKERKLKVSGKKADLVERLMMYEAMPVKFDTLSEEELIDMCKSRGLSSDGKIDKLIDRLTQDSLFVQRMTSEQDKREAEISTKKPSKWKEITIKSLGLTPTDFSPAGTPQVSAAVLRKLSGTNLFGDPKDAVYGTLYDHFKPHGEEAAIKACEAVGALAMVGQIDATITNFLVPLQTLVDKNKRIHCSLNLNTETGRLSSRRPNLQNQPALEKDQYKIRDAFIAEPGNTLIVADYGQLELRLMAHMTNCESMIEAFRSGGCFHSRTAMGMYPYIADAVNKGDVLLEWDYSKGQPTVPLVKDQYGSERRKAKTLNFSIAYGKTVHGLAADWGITTEEAEKTLQAWYNDRPEVKEWQEKTRNMAKGLGFVRTIMGRYRILPNANERGPAGGHALRAAINSPIQGSAADIVMMAMLKLWRSEVLKEKGWKLLLQIHDEVILEGPKDTCDEALAEVIACMENPFDDKGLMPVSVHLDVDAKSEDSWYKAK